MTIKGTLHALLSILTWILFAYWWKKVIPQTNPGDAKAAFLGITLTVLVISIFTFLWVRHNIAVFRRKGPRRNLLQVSEERFADHLGRKLDRPEAEILKNAPIIVVSLTGDRKHFVLPSAGGSLDRRPVSASLKGGSKIHGIPQGV